MRTCAYTHNHKVTSTHLKTWPNLTSPRYIGLSPVPFYRGRLRKVHHDCAFRLGNRCGYLGPQSDGHLWSDSPIERAIGSMHVLCRSIALEVTVLMAPTCSVGGSACGVFLQASKCWRSTPQVLRECSTAEGLSLNSSVLLQPFCGLDQLWDSLRPLPRCAYLDGPLVSGLEPEWTF